MTPDSEVSASECEGRWSGGVPLNFEGIEIKLLFAM
jgi:hypothetical protein